MEISPHFADTNFRCKCGCGLMLYHKALIAGLEDLRAAATRHNAKDTPILITRGVSCRSHNAAIGGEPDSQHLYGLAADIVIPSMLAYDISVLAQTIPIFNKGGVGYYPGGNMAHVDVRPDGPARWKRVGGIGSGGPYEYAPWDGKSQ